MSPLLLRKQYLSEELWRFKVYGDGEATADEEDQSAVTDEYRGAGSERYRAVQQPAEIPRERIRFYLVTIYIMPAIVYVLLGINFLLVLFIVFMIERMVMIMKANTLSELLKYKQQQARGFQPEESDEDYVI